MANEKTQVEIDAAVDAAIKVNGNREITPPLHNAIEKMLSNSNLNKKDGGILQALAFYNTAFSLTDPLTLVYKSYVDDLVTALNALVQGINTLTENTTIYNNTFTLLLHSGVDGSETQAYKFSIEPAGVGMVYQDDVDPTQNSGVSLVPGAVMITGAIQTNGNPVYWKGDPSAPSSGDIRELMVGTELQLQEYNGTTWDVRSTR